MMRMLAVCGLLSWSVLAAADPAGVLIDVRSPEEFAHGHVAGAVNLPHDTIAERIAEVAPDPDTPIRLYCRSGRRAALAEQALRARGYREVHNLGGLADALAAGVGACVGECP